MDLAEAITAAVGVQPVPQLPPKQSLPAGGTGLQMAPGVQQLAACQHEEQAASVSAPLVASYPVDMFPIRRPTPAEVRATSPPAAGSLQQELCSDAVMSRPLFDDMDSLQQQHSALEQLRSVAADADAVALAAVSAAHSNLHTAPLSQHQQHQLLSQLWSELQSPKADRLCDSHPLQLAKTGSGMLSDLSNTGEALHPSSSCSSEGALDAAALAAVADAAAAAAAAPDSPCSSVQSKALSTCSTSSSKKRVSWGAPVVHQLPPEEPPSMLTTVWHQLQDWWTPEHADWQDSSRTTWSPTVVTTTAVVSLAAAAGVAALLAHRTRSS
jgi:hypothetical protein